MTEKKIKKVLSIDMDYIMSPCIQLYNDLSGSPEFREGGFWDRVNEVRNIDKYLEYDAQKYLSLVELLATQLRKLDKECFFFAEEHDMILEFLCNENHKNEVFDIYNVDHHHDIYYSEESKEEVDRFDFTTLANWVYYLGKNEKVNKYYWVRNENSDMLIEQWINELPFPVDFDTYLDNMWKLITEVDFDYVFICRSNEFFPAKFNHLFESLYKMACATKNYNFFVWSDMYCKDGKSRPINC